jgi:hypothetical protein
VLGFWLAEVEGHGVAGLLFAIFWSSIVSATVLIARWWFLTRAPHGEAGASGSD